MFQGRSDAAPARVERAREDALRTKLEERLRPLTDARYRAEDAAWSQTLDVYRVVKALISMRPELEDAFAKIADVFARNASKTEDPATP